MQPHVPPFSLPQTPTAYFRYHEAHPISGGGDWSKSAAPDAASHTMGEAGGADDDAACEEDEEVTTIPAGAVRLVRTRRPDQQQQPLTGMQGHAGHGHVPNGHGDSAIRGGGGTSNPRPPLPEQARAILAERCAELLSNGGAALSRADGETIFGTHPDSSAPSSSSSTGGASNTNTNANANAKTNTALPSLRAAAVPSALRVDDAAFRHLLAACARHFPRPHHVFGRFFRARALVARRLRIGYALRSSSRRVS